MNSPNSTRLLEVDGSGRTFDGKWVLVPVEPTVAMSAAGMRYIKSVQTDHFQKYAGGIANSIYEKMLTAAQEGIREMKESQS